MAIVFAKVSSLMSFANRISPGLCFGPVSPDAAFAAASFSCLSFAEKSLIISRRRLTRSFAADRGPRASGCASGCAPGERALRLLDAREASNAVDRSRADRGIAFTGDSHRSDEGERLFERKLEFLFLYRRSLPQVDEIFRLESRPRDAPKRNRTISPHSLHLARATMAALSSTVHISSAKALAPKAAKRAVAVKAAARADSNNEVRLPPENHRG